MVIVRPRKNKARKGNLVEQLITKINKKSLRVMNKGGKEYNVRLSDEVKDILDTVEVKDLAMINTDTWTVVSIQKQEKPRELTREEEERELARQMKEFEELLGGY